MTMITSGFSTRLAGLAAEMGLSQQQLGVTRVYSQPHSTHAGQPLAGEEVLIKDLQQVAGCLLYTSPSPRDRG